MTWSACFYGGEVDGVPALRDHCHRQTERKEIGLARETRHHRPIDDQSQRIISTRDRGLQGRMTPDRMGGITYDVISPSLSIMSSTKQSAWSCTTLILRLHSYLTAALLEKSLGLFAHFPIQSLQHQGRRAIQRDHSTRGIPSCLDWERGTR